MPVCKVCKGSGNQHLIVHWRGSDYSPETDEMDIPCVWCEGSGEMLPEVLAEYEWNQTAWCKCGNPSRKTIFYDNGEHPGCVHKHHYHCADCGKVIQIG